MWKRVLKRLFLLGFLVLGSWRISKSRSFQFFGGMINNIQTTGNLVALTFDDGPTSGNTDKVLFVLKHNKVKASFFVIGNEIEKNPGELQKIIADGHQIGNHSYSHQRMVLKTPSRVEQEILKTDNLIRSAGYTGTTSFRTPYGKRLLVTPYILKKMNKANVLYDIEPESFSGVAGSGLAIYNFVMDYAHSGSIILLHPMYGSHNETLYALNSIIKGLKKRGFQLVTVDELMAKTNTVPRFNALISFKELLPRWSRSKILKSVLHHKSG